MATNKASADKIMDEFIKGIKSKDAEKNAADEYMDLFIKSIKPLEALKQQNEKQTSALEKQNAEIKNALNSTQNNIYTSFAQYGEELRKGNTAEAQSIKNNALSGLKGDEYYTKTELAPKEKSLEEATRLSTQYQQNQAQLNTLRNEANEIKQAQNTLTATRLYNEFSTDANKAKYIEADKKGISSAPNYTEGQTLSFNANKLAQIGEAWRTEGKEYVPGEMDAADFAALKEEEQDFIRWTRNKYGEEQAKIVADGLIAGAREKQANEMLAIYKSNPIFAIAGKTVEAFQRNFEDKITGLTGNYTENPSVSELTWSKYRGELSGIGGAIYDIIDGIGYMAPDLILGAAMGGAGVPAAALKVFSGVTSFLRSKGNAYEEAMRNGYSEEQANAYGNLVGATEGTMEYFLNGITALGGSPLKGFGAKLLNSFNSSLAKTALSFGGTFLKEGAEEGLQELIDPLLKNIAFNENNEINPFSADVWYSFLIGGLTGAVIESPNLIGSYKGEKQVKKAAGESIKKAGQELDIINAGLSMPTDTEAYQNALNLYKQTLEGKEISAEDIGNEAQLIYTYGEENDFDFNQMYDAEDISVENLANIKATTGATLSDLVQQRLFRNTILNPENTQQLIDTFGAEAATELQNAALRQDEKIRAQEVEKARQSLELAENNEKAIEKAIDAEMKKRGDNAELLKAIDNINNYAKKRRLKVRYEFDESDNADNGSITGNVVTVNLASDANEQSIAIHEFLHDIKRTDAKAANRLYKAILSLAKKEGLSDYAEKVKNEYLVRVPNADIEAEVTGKLVEKLLKNPDKILTEAQKNKTFGRQILDFVVGLKRKIKNVFGIETPSLTDIENQLTSILRDTPITEDAESNTKKERSLIGVGEDGIKIYTTDFAPGTTDTEKTKKILELVTTVLTEKPLTLEIIRDGKKEVITAIFDPSLEDDMPAQKMADGNRAGNSTERKVSKNLINDMWDIAQESTYEDYKGETHEKSTKMHDKTKIWHYFKNQVRYVESENPQRNGLYRFKLDVAEATDGNYVYSYAFRKIKEGTDKNPAPSEESASSGTPSNNNLSQNDNIVNNSIRSTTAKDTQKSLNIKENELNENPKKDEQTSLAIEQTAPQKITKKRIEKTVRILREMPEKDMKYKNDFRALKEWSQRLFTNENASIEAFGKDAGDNTLKTYANSVNQAYATAQNMISKAAVDIRGKVTGASLKSVFDKVREVDYKATAEAREKNPDAKPITTNQDLFQQYLFYKHNSWRAKQKKGVGFSEKESVARYTKIEEEHPEFKKLAEEIYKYTDNLLEWQVQAGEITRELKDKLKEMYPNYVPFYRDKTFFEYDDMVAPGKDFIAIKSSVKYAKESKNPVPILPFESSLESLTRQVVSNARKNILTNKIFDDILAHPEMAARYVNKVGMSGAVDMDMVGDIVDMLDDINLIIQTDRGAEKGNFIYFMRGGNQYYINADDAIYSAYKAWSKPKNDNKILKALEGINIGFKGLITGKNPIFTVTNFFKDLQDAYLFGKNSIANYTRNYGKAVKELSQNGDLADLYYGLGGAQSSLLYMDENYTKDGRPRNTVSRISKKTLDKIEALNMGVEQAPRLAEFMATIDDYKKANNITSNNMDDIPYDVIMQAMYNAADITVNFGRSGSLTKVLNRYLVPFFNPSIQGASKFVRMFTETKGAKAWTSLVVKLAGMGILPGIINSLIWNDDDEYKIINDRDKDRNYLFKLSDGYWLKIPKGRALSIFQAFGTMAGDVMSGKSDLSLDNFVQRIGDLTVEQVAPSNPLENNIAAPIIRAFTNKTWYGDDIDTEQDMTLPAGERYNESTDAISKFIGGALNISPKRINSVLDGYSGIIGDILLPLLSPKAERGGIAAPLLSKFTIDSTTSNKLSGEFYDLRDKLEQRKKSTKATAADAATYKFWQNQASAFSDINKEIHEIEADITIGNNEKYDAVRVLKAERNVMYQAALDNIKRFEDAADEYKGYANTEENAKDVLLIASRDAFGADYAIEANASESTVKEAKNAVKYGNISPDEYFDAYVATLGIEGDKDKYGNTISGSAQEKKLEAIKNDLGVTDEKAEEIYKAAFVYKYTPEEFSSAQREKMNVANEKGYTNNDFINAYNATRWIEGEKDEEGKTISGTKKQNCLEAIMTAGYDWKQANDLYCLINGYDLKSNYGAVKTGTGNRVSSSRSKFKITYPETQKLKDIGINFITYAKAKEAVSGLSSVKAIVSALRNKGFEWVEANQIADIIKGKTPKKTYSLPK